MDRQLLRQQAAQALANMSAERRREVNASLCRAVYAQLDSEPQRIGGYLPIGFEIDLRPLLHAAIERGHQVFLPRVVRRGSGLMQFLQWSGDVDDLQPDAYGIPAPGAGAWMCAAQRLDLVLVPGRAFDRLGNRLGSGGGFYDRAFAFRRDAAAPPRLLGIACAELRCADLTPQAWDVPMDEVLFGDDAG